MSSPLSLFQSSSFSETAKVIIQPRKLILNFFFCLPNFFFFACRLLQSQFLSSSFPTNYENVFLAWWKRRINRTLVCFPQNIYFNITMQTASRKWYCKRFLANSLTTCITHYLICITFLFQVRRRLRPRRAAEERHPWIHGHAQGLAQRAQEEPLPNQRRKNHASYHYQNDPHAGKKWRCKRFPEIIKLIKYCKKLFSKLIT